MCVSFNDHIGCAAQTQVHRVDSLTRVACAMRVTLQDYVWVACVVCVLCVWILVWTKEVGRRLLFGLFHGSKREPAIVGWECLGINWQSLLDYKLCIFHIELCVCDFQTKWFTVKLLSVCVQCNSVDSEELWTCWVILNVQYGLWSKRLIEEFTWVCSVVFTTIIYST